MSAVCPGTNQVEQRIPVGNGASGIAVAPNFVWVANSVDGTLSQIDPRAERVVKTPPVGNDPTGVVFARSSLWVADSGDRTVVRLDPASGQRQQTFSAPAGADAIADSGTTQVRGDAARL